MAAGRSNAIVRILKALLLVIAVAVVAFLIGYFIGLRLAVVAPGIL